MIADLMSTEIGVTMVYTFGILVIFLLINYLLVDSFIFDTLLLLGFSILFGSIWNYYDSSFNIDDVFFLRTFGIFIVLLVSYLLFQKFVVKLADESNTITSKDYEGKVGTVTTTIPKDGVGEVMVTVSLQKVSKQAKIYQNEKTLELEEIKSGTEVLIIENTDFLFVVPYKKMFE